jgi:hypothetical protein
VPTPLATTVFPGVKEYGVISRELTPAAGINSGTLVLPTTLQGDKYEPDEHPVFLDDKSLVGSMTDQGNVIAGTAQSEWDFGGPVFLDQIPHVLYNLMGDYTATGAAGSGSTTLTAQVAAGATTATVASITGFSSGQAVQLAGTSGTEVVVLSAAPSGSTLTFTGTPARFLHANGAAVTGVVAPFVHVFSLYNGTNGQPVTHNVDFYSGVPLTTGTRRYSYWCCSGVDFDMNTEQLFTQQTKGMSFLSQVAAATPTQQVSAVFAQPNWRVQTALGGPLPGSAINDVQSPSISIARQLKAEFTGDGSQSPFVIVRNSLNITGKFTRVAQDESAILNMLNNTQQQLQIVIDNGLAGAAHLKFQLDMQLAQYSAAKMNTQEAILYDVEFKGVRNTTNAGISGGVSPGMITITNAVPTY